MGNRHTTWGLTWTFIVLLAFPCSAQTSTGDASSILSGMSPELLANVYALAQQLQQGIKEGKISEVDVQQGLFSGQLAERLKSLNPQAARLLEDINGAMRNGQNPGESALIPLLGELGPSPH